MTSVLLLVFLLETATSPICMALRDGDASLGVPDATCQKSVLDTGEVQATCHWAYAAETGTGAARFAELTGLVELCLPGATVLPMEPGVNHPDSYDQRIYEAENWRISLSLKKKGALGQTFIFMGISARP